MPEELPQIIGALALLIFGVMIISKVAQILMKLGIAIIILGILAALFHDQLPFP